MDNKDYRNKLIEEISIILRKEFPNIRQKQSIRDKKNILMFACPICGDSASNPNKKRGCIVLEGKFANYYKCHNCGFFCTIPEFLKRYKVSDLDINEYVFDNIKDFSGFDNDFDVSLLLDLDLVDKYAISKDKFMKLTKTIPIENTIGHKWLRKRLIFDTNQFVYNPAHNSIFILNLTDHNKVLGYQERFLNKKQYCTYKLSNIYSNIDLIKNIEVPESVDIYSTIFNICNINPNKPVIVCEGPLDAYLIKKHNTVALSGASKHLPNIFKYKFLFDSDVTGKTHAIKKLEDGFEVFLWDRYIKENELPERKKWDINDVIIYCYENNIKVPNIMNYFSDEKLDIIDI